jgi:Cdc6-like AAA superfamily ATPase
MQRVDVRCKVDLPVTLLKVNGGQSVETKEAAFSVISLNGGLIDYKKQPLKQKVVGLRYKLPKHGEFDMLGKVIYKDKHGVAVQFYNVNRDTKLKLWDYIKENISVEKTCPYCSAEVTQKVNKCNVCGWSLNFYSPDYLVHHEKESFLNRLTMRSRELSIEDICKILNYIDVEILGIGKSWDINEEFVGSSIAMLDVFSKIRKIAPTDRTVLITGENGTGKELTARAIYERSTRRGRPFVHVNCSSIPMHMQVTELFGSESNEDISAGGGKAGKLEYADKGTIFLNDIDHLSEEAQSKLMRFLDDQTVKRVGGKSGRQLDVRVIAAAGTDIKLKGTFLNNLDASQIHLQPVRDRGNDKIILARYFLNKFSRELNVNKNFSNEALEAIQNYEWSGNVREIINKVRMAVLLSSDVDISAADLNVAFTPKSVDAISTMRDAKSVIEEKKLAEALRLCNNNISKTAKVLGISRPSVYNLKKKFGI